MQQVAFDAWRCQDSLSDAVGKNGRADKVPFRDYSITGGPFFLTELVLEPVVGTDYGKPPWDGEEFLT